MTADAVAVAPNRTLRLLGREIPVILPRRDDPRLRLAVVIGALQVLGQVGLGFRVSIAQILVTIAVCAAIEVGVGWRRQHALVWPASAMLTGNSTAFILRASGTAHGDWWSLNGIEWFVLAAVLGLLSKYLLRLGGRHVFNPSNAGLVLVLLLVGPLHVYPQWLWWGPMSPAVAAALVVIAAGGVWVLRPLRMWPMAAAFGLTFGVAVGAIAAGGQCFDAIWRPDSICGSDYWLTVCASPEVLVFVLFMMSDPRTSPGGPWPRALFGAATAAVAAGLIFAQPSEYGIKVALLAALTVVCAVRALAWAGGQLVGGRRGFPERAAGLLTSPALIAVTLIGFTVPGLVLRLASDQAVLAIDRGEAPRGAQSPQ